MIFLASLLLTTATLNAMTPSPSSPIVIHSHSLPSLSLQIEAIDNDTIRLWYRDSKLAIRTTSEATRHAPTDRIALEPHSEGGNTQLHTDTVIVTVTPDLEVELKDAASHQVIAGPFKVTQFTPGGKWSLTQTVDKHEHLHGLGEDNANLGKFDRRGTVRELWAGQQIRSGNVTAEFPIPFMISSSPERPSYGLFVDNVHRLRYDLAKSDPNTVTIEADGGEADLYVMNGPSSKQVVEKYTALTGRPSLPPLWALGFWQSRCVFFNWNDFDTAYNELTKRGFPVDVMVIDYDWAQFMNNYVWDKRWFVDGKTPAERVEEYRKKGVKIILSNSGPMVKKESPTFASGWPMGVFANDGNGNPVQCGHFGGQLIDITSPKIKDWLYPQLQPRNQEGIAGWWLDLTEPEGEPPQTVYHGGHSADIHNQYAFLITRTFEQSQLKDNPDRRPCILTRAGGAGIQRLHSSLWTGDVYSDYATLRAHPGEMLNSGLSGIAYWTCDTGGFMTGFYKEDRYGAHARLYERWMQFSAFSPLTRAHKAGPSIPYDFGIATEQGTKHYLNLRYQLLPYIYSYAYQASQNGLSIVRPMAMEFPSDTVAADLPGDQYMFGEFLLVAPVLNEGLTNREVYFPAGRWFDWDTNVAYEGGKRYVVAAPQNRIPVAVRAGAIIPMAPEMSNTVTGSWDPISVEVWPSGRSSFQMYKDDGESFGYTKGEHTITDFVSEASSGKVKFEIKESNRKFAPAHYVVRFHLEQVPNGVQIDGSPVELAWDAKTRILTVQVDAAAKTHHMIEVSISDTITLAPQAPILTLDKIDVTGEAVGGGKPVPHFFPAPMLPNIVKAANYDKGGEGIAFHHATGVTVGKYRPDDIGARETDDTGGGYALHGLGKDDWVRYSVDAANGGYFDLVARVQGEGSFHVISGARDVTGLVHTPASKGWEDVVIPNVYLRPGEESLVFYVDQAGFTLRHLEFRSAANPPQRVPAILGGAVGQPSIDHKPTGDVLRGIVEQKGSVSYGLLSPTTGKVKVRLHYSLGAKATWPVTVEAGKAHAVKVLIPPTGGGDAWKDLDIEVSFVKGYNRFVLSWANETFDSAAIEWLEVIP